MKNAGRGGYTSRGLASGGRGAGRLGESRSGLWRTVAWSRSAPTQLGINFGKRRTGASLSVQGRGKKLAPGPTSKLSGATRKIPSVASRKALSPDRAAHTHCGVLQTPTGTQTQDGMDWQGFHGVPKDLDASQPDRAI